MLSNLKAYDIILGSGSPRRKELFSKLIQEFKIVTSGSEENYPDTMAAEEVPVYLSKMKADDISRHLNDHFLLIAADTVVISNGEVQGKPVNEEEAREMLKKLSGTTHEVISGVTIKSSEHEKSFSDLTRVSIARLSDYEIRWYVKNCQVLDKAGAYGIQDWFGIAKVSDLQGSYYNVMGLPTEKLYRVLVNWK